MRDSKGRFVKGHRQSKESRQKMSDAKKENPVKYWLEKERTDETKQKISDIRKERPNRYWLGKKLSEEHKKKSSVGYFKNGHIPWHKGKTGVYSEETIQKIRDGRKHQIFPLLDTKPERIIQIALSLENISYKKHKPFKMKSGSYHQVDLFIEPNIVIEIDGCYWHSCKQCGFNYPPRIEKDRIINESLKQQGYKILRFWEHEIKADVTKIVERIKAEQNKNTMTTVSA